MQDLDPRLVVALAAESRKHLERGREAVVSAGDGVKRVADEVQKEDAAVFPPFDGFKSRAALPNDPATVFEFAAAGAGGQPPDLHP